MIAIDVPDTSAASDLIALQRRIHRAARDAAAPLEQIMPWLVNETNLEAAWERVRTNSGAQTPGLDGVTRAELDGRSAPWLDQLRQELADGTFRPQLPRWVEVPRDDRHPHGPTRRLGILALRDRVVHAAIRQVMEPIFDPMFHPHSFGFRCGRSVPGAVDLVCQAAGRARLSHAWAVRLDVADCFDTIDHDHLLAQIRARITDRPFLTLIQSILTQGGVPAGRGWFRRRRAHGVVQGSALSPLLCNIALNPLDHEVNGARLDGTHSKRNLGRTGPDLPAAGHSRRGGLPGRGTGHSAEVALFRYADDMLLLAPDRRAARRAVRLITRRLTQCRQTLKARKHHAGPLRLGVDWLGMQIAPRQRLQQLTGAIEFAPTIPDDRVRAMLARIDELTVPPSSRLDIDAFDPARWIVSINTQLRQWAQAYRLADDAPAVFRMIDRHAREQTLPLLRRITGLPLRELWKSHRLRLPRGFWTWQIDGVRLVQLAALAPVNADRLVRRPPWAVRSRHDRSSRSPGGPHASRASRSARNGLPATHRPTAETSWPESDIH